MTTITEADVEQAGLAWLAGAGPAATKWSCQGSASGNLRIGRVR